MRLCVCIYDSREAATVITRFLFFAGVSVFHLQRFLHFEVVTDLIGLAGKARRVYAWLIHACVCGWFTDQADKILSILQSLGGKRETLRFSTFLCPAVHPWIIQTSSLFPPLALTHIMSSVGIKVNFPLIWMETEVMYQLENPSWVIILAPSCFLCNSL